MTEPTADVLIVMSKVKKHLKETHGLNTSGKVSDVLSQIVRRECDKAAVLAKTDGRITVLDRDFVV